MLYRVDKWNIFYLCYPQSSAFFFLLAITLATLHWPQVRLFVDAQANFEPRGPSRLSRGQQQRAHTPDHHETAGEAGKINGWLRSS